MRLKFAIRLAYLTCSPFLHNLIKFYRSFISCSPMACFLRESTALVAFFTSAALCLQMVCSCYVVAISSMICVTRFMTTAILIIVVSVSPVGSGPGDSLSFIKKVISLASPAERSISLYISEAKDSNRLISFSDRATSASTKIARILAWNDISSKSEMISVTRSLITVTAIPFFCV